jgi:hypothetical protein
MNGTGCCGGVMNHFFYKLKRAEAVCVKGKRFVIINVEKGLVDGYQFGPVVSFGGPYSPRVDGVALSCSRDIYCSTYFARVPWFTFY